MPKTECSNNAVACKWKITAWAVILYNQNLSFKNTQGSLFCRQQGQLADTGNSCPGAILNNKGLNHFPVLSVLDLPSWSFFCLLFCSQLILFISDERTKEWKNQLNLSSKVLFRKSNISNRVFMAVVSSGLRCAALAKSFAWALDGFNFRSLLFTN